MSYEQTKKKREQVKKKIRWYCYQMRITEPKQWTYDEVSRVAKEINKREHQILVCRDCHRLDVSYPHDCDPQYEAYRQESMEHYK